MLARNIMNTIGQKYYEHNPGQKLQCLYENLLRMSNIPLKWLLKKIWIVN